MNLKRLVDGADNVQAFLSKCAKARKYAVRSHDKRTGSDHYFYFDTEDEAKSNISESATTYDMYEGPVEVYKVMWRGEKERWMHPGRIKACLESRLYSDWVKPVGDKKVSDAEVRTVSDGWEYRVVEMPANKEEIVHSERVNGMYAATTLAEHIVSKTHNPCVIERGTGNEWQRGSRVYFWQSGQVQSKVTK